MSEGFPKPKSAEVTHVPAPETLEVVRDGLLKKLHETQDSQLENIETMDSETDDVLEYDSEFGTLGGEDLGKTIEEVKKRNNKPES